MAFCIKEGGKTLEITDLFLMPWVFLHHLRIDHGYLYTIINNIYIWNLKRGGIYNSLTCGILTFH